MHLISHRLNQAHLFSVHPTCTKFISNSQLCHCLFWPQPISNHQLLYHKSRVLSGCNQPIYCFLQTFTWCWITKPISSRHSLFLRIIETLFSCEISCLYLTGVPTVVGTPVKYKCDSKVLTVIFAKVKISPKRQIRELSFGNSHSWSSGIADLPG